MKAAAANPFRFAFAGMIAMAAALPKRLDASRAISCGFRVDLLGPGPELGFEDIIRIHAEDDLDSLTPFEAS